MKSFGHIPDLTLVSGSIHRAIDWWLCIKFQYGQILALWTLGCDLTFPFNLCSIQDMNINEGKSCHFEFPRACTRQGLSRGPKLQLASDSPKTAQAEHLLLRNVI